MRRSRGQNRVLRPVALDLTGGPPAGTDDLSTWASSQTISTMALPEPAIDPELVPQPESTSVTYPLLVDVTNIIDAAALADVNALRFRSDTGIRFGHYRTASNRILLGGDFHSGVNTFNVYWGKAGATQPGLGFPSAADVVFPYRLALIFEGGAPIDLSPDPATWTIVGTPTFTAAGPLGSAMTCAAGSYISTTAAKLRSNARDHRSAFIVFSVKTAGAEARLLSWANWETNNRAWMLWIGPYLELYLSNSGTSFHPWRYPDDAVSGWNAAGGAWQATEAEAIYLLNGNAGYTASAFEGAPIGNLFDSAAPYIVGGTQIAGAIHDDKINCLFEMKETVPTPTNFLWWELAWAKNPVFWGELDTTPDNFDVPDQTGVALSTEVAFPRKQITGISAATPVSVSGSGNPTYSVGSSFAVPADLKAKAATPGTINNGNWLATYHTSAATNSAITASSATVGSVTSPRRSTTVATSVPGGSGDPDGAATVVVNSISALKAAFYAAKNGDVIELVAGDYKSQGNLELLNKDFRGGAMVWIRASVRPYRGPLPSQGGLMVSGESYFVSGSGGFEVPYIKLTNVHNVGFDGMRGYYGSTTNYQYSAVDIIGCTNLTFQYCKFCGFKPSEPETAWNSDYVANHPWKFQSLGLKIGVGGWCDRLTFKKCIFHYFGAGIYLLACGNPLFEDCVFTDQRNDHLRNDGAQDNFIARRCIFYRMFDRFNQDGTISHSDHLQNTTKTQPGWKNHTIEKCLFSAGDSFYPHIQCAFYECDNFPSYPQGTGLNVTDTLIESRVANTIYARPANNVKVTRCTVLQHQFGGRSYDRDLTFNNPSITFNASGLSQGNNLIHRSVYHTSSLGGGDQVTDSTQLQSNGYAANLENYPPYSSSLWQQALFLNPYTGVIVPSELRKMAPKASSSIHPNQKGYHYGASQLFEDYGALP